MLNEQRFGVGYNPSGSLFVVDIVEATEDSERILLILSREALEQLKQSIEFALLHYPQVDK